MADQLEAYTAAFAARVREVLGDEVVGLWLMGSGALGDWDPVRSDVDLLLVTRTVRPAEERRRVAAALDDRALPGPGQGLEFVWYARDDVRPLGETPAYQLNLNGGRDREHKLQLGPGDEAAHWFVIDLAIGRAVAVPLIGPPLAEVATEIPGERLVAALRASITWHDQHLGGSPNQVLNAARAFEYVETGRWFSKPVAARRLARRRPDLAPALRAAAQARLDGSDLDPEQAARVSQATGQRLTAMHRVVGADPM